MTRWPGFYILQWKFHSMPACAATNLPRVDDVLASLQVSSHKCKVMYYTEVIGSEDFRYALRQRGPGPRLGAGGGGSGPLTITGSRGRLCPGHGEPRPGDPGGRSGLLSRGCGEQDLAGGGHSAGSRAARASRRALAVCLQRLHDQPGVQPQRVLPAERRHHLLQPVPLQLHGFQVVPRRLSSDSQRSTSGQC